MFHLKFLRPLQKPRQNSLRFSRRLPLGVRRVPPLHHVVSVQLPRRLRHRPPEQIVLPVALARQRALRQPRLARLLSQLQAPLGEQRREGVVAGDVVQLEVAHARLVLAQLVQLVQPLEVGAPH